METIIILSLLNIIILVISVVIISSTNKIKDKRWIELIIKKVDIENINLDNCFSEDIWAFYTSVLKETNKYILTEHTLGKTEDAIEIWAANDIYSRRFYTNDEELKDTVKKMNKNLTYYDRLLLDKLIQSFKNRQNKLVTKFFI